MRAASPFALVRESRKSTSRPSRGGRALMVNAIDGEAAAFWRRRGFISSRDGQLVLFRSIADIAASSAEARS